MAGDDVKPLPPELESLNVADLDVEELEKRLELAIAHPDADCYSFDCNSNKPAP